jgi:RNA polymerase sigma-70 factor, ECF subfamily
VPTQNRELRSPSERVGTVERAALPPPESFHHSDEHLLVRALRERDERAFETLLDLYYSPMLRLARTYVRTTAEAEEVVQDTWLAVLSGLHRFAGRSSLKTWIFRILCNRARTRARREARLIPFSEFQTTGLGPGGEVSPMDRFQAEASPAPLWHSQVGNRRDPQEQYLLDELREQVTAAIASLPARQQEVITLRDVEGWSADEVCELLDLSAANQRVLLHRARMKVREILEPYLATAARPILASASREVH